MLKKYMLKSAVALMAACSLYGGTVYAYSDPVAVITNYEDVEGEISIYRANGEPDGAEALLYPGDYIAGEIQSVNIDCGPYASYSSDGSGYVISYDPPSGIWGIAQSIYNNVSSFWSNVERVVSGSSRGTIAEIDLNPQPGFDVTLLSGQDVVFSWEKPNNNVLQIKNEKGKIIYEKKVSGLTEIKLQANDIKAEAGKRYTWNLDNDGWEYKFVVLDAETEKNVRSNIEAIDNEPISADEKLLKKAKYMQLLSDMYPDKIDLYWLSAQLLSQVTSKDKEAEKEMNVMLKKCKRHIDKEMQ